MSEIDSSKYFLQLDQPTKRSCDYQQTTTETIEKLTEILKGLRNEDQ